jgi:hypothetical protein
MVDLVLREEKGAALTHAEMDQNLKNLKDAVETVTSTTLTTATVNKQAVAMAIALG